MFQRKDVDCGEHSTPNSDQQLFKCDDPFPVLEVQRERPSRTDQLLLRSLPFDLHGIRRFRIVIMIAWMLPLPTLQHRQFQLWLENNPYFAHSNFTFEDQFHAYCQIYFTLIMVFAIIMIVIQSRRSELITRYDFIWKLQALEEQIEMKRRHEQNRLVLENILPRHVATHFLDSPEDKHMTSRPKLYSDDRPFACIAFITLTEFSQFYMELDANNEGVECLRVLNEIISDFDELLNLPEFKCIEKIKTISTTYMAASGLQGTDEGHQHVVAVANFAISLFSVIARINEHSFNNFNLRVGINVGPVVAGVIGARKPHYDIWGNSVNVASRMDSSGIPGRIQVTEETKRILEKEGFKFECRGEINVKGKGLMTTYLMEVPEEDDTFINHKPSMTNGYIKDEIKDEF